MFLNYLPIKSTCKVLDPRKQIPHKKPLRCSHKVPTHSPARQGEKIASASAVKNPSRQKFKMAKTFRPNTAYFGKIQRCSIHTQTVTEMFKSLSASSADSLWAEDRNAPIRERHFHCLFP